MDKIRTELGLHDEYCLGGPISMKQCETCPHARAWKLINELQDAEFQLHKAGMNRMDESLCALSSGRVMKHKEIKSTVVFTHMG